MTSLFRVIKANHLHLSPTRVIASRLDKKAIDDNSSCHDAVLAETELMVQQLLNEAREKAENIIAEARVEAEEMVADARRKASELEEQAQKEGYEAGFLSAQEDLAGEREQLHLEIARQKEAVLKERDILIKQLEPDIIQLAVIIARSIIHAELKTAPEQVKTIAEAVLAKAQGDGELTLKVSSRNYDAVNSFIQEDTLSEERINVQIDNSISMGCRMETPFGEIDASVEGQLQEVACDLLEVSEK